MLSNVLTYEYEKQGNIISTSYSDIPLIRTYKNNRKLEIYLFNSKYIWLIKYCLDGTN